MSPREFVETELNDVPRSIDTYLEESYQNTNSKLNYLLIFAALGIANSGDASEMNSMNYLFGNKEFKEEILDGDLLVRGAILAGIVYLGMVVSGILAGAFGDRLGRRSTLLTGLFINAICGAFGVISSNFHVICFFRFGCGVGIGAVASSFSSLASEFALPSMRGSIVAFVSSFWTFGVVYNSLLALIMFGVYDVPWRFFLAGTMLPVTLGCIMVYLFIPESPRYLAMQGRYKDAANSANMLAHSMGYRGRTLEEEEIRHFFPAKPINKGKNNVRFIFSDIIRNISLLYLSRLCHQTLLLQLTFAFISIGSGLGIWINTFFKEMELDSIYLFLFAYSLSNIPGNIVATLFIDKIGRKNLMLLGLLGASVSLGFLSWIISFDEVSPISIVVSSCVYHSFFVMAYPCSIFVVANESFPTSVRSTGVGICMASFRLSSVGTQFIYAALITSPTILFTIIAGALLVAAFFSNSIPDNTNKPLNDDDVCLNVKLFEEK